MIASEKCTYDLTKVLSSMFDRILLCFCKLVFTSSTHFGMSGMSEARINACGTYSRHWDRVLKIKLGQMRFFSKNIHTWNLNKVTITICWSLENHIIRGTSFRIWGKRLAIWRIFLIWFFWSFYRHFLQ